MPNSFLWIGLVVVWVVVLFPMLADRHPRIRQTTDAALSTRVLHRGGSKRRVVRGPASGHESDPNWRPSARPERTESRGIDAEDLMETHAEEPATPVEVDELETDETADDRATPEAKPEKIVAGPDIRAEETDSEERDDRTEMAEDESLQDDRIAAEAAEPVDEELAEEAQPQGRIPVRRGRGGFDPEADAIARAARYSFRQRAVLGLVLGAILFAALALVVSSKLWWVCAIAVIGFVSYLSYLRRQVRMEEEIRRRRMARLGRSRLGVESTTDEELELVPARRRRAGAVVLEMDDEDPVFEHLEHFDAASLGRPVQRPAEVQMRRAAGQ